LQRPSRNSSNEVFSNKANLRTATYFTARPLIISRRFSNGHHEPLLLMTTSDEIHGLRDLEFIVTWALRRAQVPNNAAFFFGVSA
jgi:hypothetical protein